VKVSLRSPFMLPKAAIVAPELTYDLPPEITASAGLDALTQLIEPFVSARANPITDSVCREGLPRAGRSLRRAYENGQDRVAREDMCLAALFGGMALANAGLGAVHGFAGPIGGMLDAPHGAVCAALLPHVIAANVMALRQRQPDSPSLPRYQETARLLTGRPNATIEDGIAWVRELVAELRIPPLGSYGLKAEHCHDLVDMASRASSMKANPIVLTAPELSSILELAT
jgi:alcohol dehydrogenase class IV